MNERCRSRARASVAAAEAARRSIALALAVAAYWGATGCKSDSDAATGEAMGANSSFVNSGEASGGTSGSQPSPSTGSQSRQPERAAFPYPWCERGGENASVREETLVDIALECANAQIEDCETAKLTRDMDSNQVIDWVNYLVTYTYGMAGCDLLTPLPGNGVNDFGPANVGVVGMQRGPLGRDDAAALIEQYAAAFASPLGLSEPERDEVEAHLWRTAAAEIDVAASSTLSACSEADAGSN